MHDHERSDGFRTFDEMNDAFRNSSEFGPATVQLSQTFLSHRMRHNDRIDSNIFSQDNIRSPPDQTIKTDIIAGPTYVGATLKMIRLRERGGGGGSGLAMDCKARTDGRTDGATVEDWTTRRRWRGRRE